MKLILIRHGEIDSNVKKVYSGRSVEPLNGIGRLQAQAAAEQLHEQEICSLFTSPLLRARQTAAIIGEHLSLTPIVSEAFNELCMGPWEGLSEDEVAARYPTEFAIWTQTPADLSLDDRETLEMLQRRVVEGVVQAVDTSNDKAVAIVSHVAVIRVLLLFVAGRSLNDYKRIHVSNASPVVIDWDRTALRVPASGR